MITRRTFLISTIAGVVVPWRLFQDSEPELAIFHTNDLHGRVDVEGVHQGLAYLAKEIRRQRGLYRSSLTLDAGDIIHGTPMEQRIGPAPVLKAMDAIRYDAATAGNHEFDFGPENFRTGARLVRFPFLSANVRDKDGDPWGPLQPSIILERASRRIAIFGLTTTATPDIQWPRTIDGIRFTDPYEAAREQVKALRSKADILICLSHLGYAEDRKLAHEAPGIDLIVGGHSHTRLDKATIENGIPIVQTGAHGKALGRIEVRFDGAKPRFDYELFDAKEGRDADVDAGYRLHAEKLAVDLDVVLTRLSSPLDFSNLQKERTAVGACLAESVRVAHKADVGLFSSSQINGSLAAGPVTRKDVYRVMTAYTRQHIVRMRVPVALAKSRVAEAGAKVQVSGEGSLVAGPAHVMQDLFLGRPGVEILFDDPLGPTVRDAVMEGLQAGVFERHPVGYSAKSFTITQLL